MKIMFTSDHPPLWDVVFNNVIDVDDIERNDKNYLIIKMDQTDETMGSKNLDEYATWLASCTDAMTQAFGPIKYLRSVIIDNVEYSDCSPHDIELYPAEHSVTIMIHYCDKIAVV